VLHLPRPDIRDTNPDTIAAIATPPGRGGIGVVRVSGSEVPSLMQALLGRKIPPRQACFTAFLDTDGSPLEQGIALYFPAPHSFTGEDVLELQAHGSMVLLDMLLARLLACGARLARPGEFSERAFLNDKIDLAQAEAIADLIDSTTEQAVRSARHSLQGEFSRLINALVEQLITLRLYVESSIDFVDEDIDFLEQGRIGEQLKALTHTLETIHHTARQGCLLREGMTVVIAGRPNAGKSSLLNRLSGRDAAIVTAQAGTTRDPLREYIQIDGMPLHVIDTAGLRDSADIVEQEGIRRARHEIAKADRILLVMDADHPLVDEALALHLPAGIPVTRLLNKIDRLGQPATCYLQDGQTCIALSALTGAGMDLLRQHLKQVMGYDGESTPVFAARRRHLDALEQARQHIHRALDHLEARVTELLAEELRLAQLDLSEITGKFSTEDLLDRIFSRFCIGK
jgi:tRNA modification GTPase